MRGGEADFTREIQSAINEDMDSPDRRFVVQEHQALTHHFDFRLEKDAVFKSWAVPKGLPDVVGVKRLAIQVDDHALEFGAFEGRIPEGEHGAGEIRVWDAGQYQLVEWIEDRIVVRLFGTRITGLFELFKFRHGKAREWLIIRRSDENRRDSHGATL